MRVQIVAFAGVGMWPPGAVVDLDDRRAERLIHDGYAMLAEEPTPKKTKEKPWPSKAS